MTKAHQFLEYFVKLNMFLSVSFVLLLADISAQKGFNYQAVLRNAQGEVLANQQVRLQLRLLEGSENGAVIFGEIHELMTNPYGTVSLIVGQGIDKVGSMDSLDFEMNNYFFHVALDEGMTGAFVDFGTDMIRPVPVAMFAMNGPEGLRGPTGEKGDPGPTGERGADGKSIRIQGFVSSFDSLPSDYAGEEGDIFVNVISGQGRVWQGDKWFEFGRFLGPKGDPGAVGPAGPKGEDGMAGPIGPKGDKGDPGIAGDSYWNLEPGMYGDTNLFYGGSVQIGTVGGLLIDTSTLDGQGFSMLLHNGTTNRRSELSEGQLNIGPAMIPLIQYPWDSYYGSTLTQKQLRIGGENSSLNVQLGAHPFSGAGNFGHLGISDDEGIEKGHLSVSDLGGGKHGLLELWGSNGFQNITLASRLGLPDFGRIVVHDDDGQNAAEMTVSNAKEGLLLTLSGGTRRTEFSSNALGGYMKFYSSQGAMATFEFDQSGNFAQAFASDVRLKENIKSMTSSLSRILQINPSYFNYIDVGAKHPTFGVIAQDLQKVFPGLVHQMQDSEYLGVDYSKFGILAIQAVKEQQENIEELKEEQQRLKQTILQLEEALNKLIANTK